MVKTVLLKKIIAKPARGKSLSKKACSSSKIIASYQDKKKKQTGNANVVRESQFFNQTKSK